MNPEQANQMMAIINERDRMRAALEYIRLTAGDDGHGGLVQLCTEALGETASSVTGPPDDYTDQLKAAAFDLFGMNQQSTAKAAERWFCNVCNQHAEWGETCPRAGCPNGDR